MSTHAESDRPPLSTAAHALTLHVGFAGARDLGCKGLPMTSIPVLDHAFLRLPNRRERENCQLPSGKLGWRCIFANG
jgi:hypothetical protein